MPFSVLRFQVWSVGFRAGGSEFRIGFDLDWRFGKTGMEEAQVSNMRQGCAKESEK